MVPHYDFSSKMTKFSLKMTKIFHFLIKMQHFFAKNRNFLSIFGIKTAFSKKNFLPAVLIFFN